MPSAITRGELARNHYTLPQAVQEELERLRLEGQLGDGAKTEPRCYVCCEAESKGLVNKLLAAGLTNREIAESCSSINNRRRAVGDNRIIEPRNIYWHRKEHFHLDEPAKAAYRTIVERHAEDANIDHINGVGTAVTPYAVMHTLMAKGFSNVASGQTPVAVKDLIAASSKLHEWTNADANQKKMADVLYMMDRIIQAAQHFIPAEQHHEFLAMVEGRAESPMGELVEKVHTTIGEEVRQFAPHSLSDEDEE